MQSPTTLYNHLLTVRKEELKQARKKRQQLGWLRLTVFLLMTAACYYSFTRAGLYGLIPLALGLAGLLWLVAKDADNNAGIRHLQQLMAINEEELLVIAHQFQQRADGARWQPHLHPYAQDMDLFGPSSLYQWLNRSYTEQGQSLLATQLLAALPPDRILQRQEAIREISPAVEWRQEWQAFASAEPLQKKTEEKIMHWLMQTDQHLAKSWWGWIPQAYSVLTLSSAVLSIAGWIPSAAFSALYLLYIIVSIVLSRNTILPYIQLGGVVKQIAGMEKMLRHLDTLPFQSPLLRQMEERKGKDAGAAIRQLKTILDRFDLRTSIIGFLFLNPFLLWDVRQMVALNKWKKENRNRVQQWFAIIAEMEVLHSLATLHLNEPQWVFPEMLSGTTKMSGKTIGHPLLPVAQRVSNDFTIEGPGRMALVTGSNMAGKSTFLRSLGVNLILAQMGAPVCASSFSTTPVFLMSSMRIADNLAENTSTFYAELKKLKSIIEAANVRTDIFILLDEILRGTNSHDRHLGSVALIRQLIQSGSLGVIATHDLELGRMQDDYPDAIHNYHFDVQVEGEELFFDYRLKEGICRSLNASLLMKKIGIDL